MLRASQGIVLTTAVLTGLCATEASARARRQPAEQAAGQQAAPAAPGVTLPEGPLRIVITAVSGVVAARTEAGGAWKKVEVGQEFDEGVELRTGPRSVVKFDIPPSSSITLDRLGIVKVLRATVESGVFVTDVGLKYGRTRFDIETAGRQHEAQIRSPSSVLAIRGTDVILDDTPGFTPRAISVTGRARFRDAAGNTSSLGGKNASRPTVVESGTGSAAETSRVQSVQQSPLNAGKTQAEQAVILNIPQAGGLPPASGSTGGGVVRLLGEGSTSGSNPTLPGGIPFPPTPPPPNANFVQGRLEFVLGWTGDADLQIGVLSPLGEPITTNPSAVLSPPDGATGPIARTSPSGAIAGADIKGGATGQFTETVVWENAFPPGQYRYGVKYNTGAGRADYKLDVIVNGVTLDPTTNGTLTGPSAGEFEGQIFEIGPVEDSASTLNLSAGGGSNSPAKPTKKKRKK